MLATPPIEVPGASLGRLPRGGGVWPNPCIERANYSRLRLLSRAGHLER